MIIFHDIHSLLSCKRALEAKAQELAQGGRRLVCHLMKDEMTVRKQIVWDGKQYRGMVDIGKKINLIIHLILYYALLLKPKPNSGLNSINPLFEVLL